jgi:hypothetical protein
MYIVSWIDIPHCDRSYVGCNIAKRVIILKVAMPVTSKLNDNPKPDLPSRISMQYDIWRRVLMLGWSVLGRDLEESFQ